MNANNLKLIILFATWALVSRYGSQAEASLESDGRELETSPVMGLHEEQREPGRRIMTNPHTSRRNITCNRTYCRVNWQRHEHVTCEYTKSTENGVSFHEQGCCAEPCASYSRTRRYHWCWVQDTGNFDPKWDRCDVGVPYYKEGNDGDRFIEYKPLPKWNIPQNLPYHLSKNLVPCKENSRCQYHSSNAKILTCETIDGARRPCCEGSCGKHGGTDYFWCRTGKGFGFIPGPWDYCTEGAPHY